MAKTCLRILLDVQMPVIYGHAGPPELPAQMELSITHLVDAIIVSGAGSNYSVGLDSLSKNDASLTDRTYYLEVMS